MRLSAVFFLLSAGLGAQTLAPLAFEPLPLGAIKPQGWLKRQLEIQAAGQTGHLDEFWPSLTPDSGWLGGPGESWERGPYYLDGLVPLAWLLDDVKLKAKAQRWINWTLENQRPDGGIGPTKNTDWWPIFVQTKVLQQYHEATGDARVLPLLTKYFAHMNREIDAKPLKEWAVSRWMDQAFVVAWLYRKTGDAFLLEVASKLRKQGYDWNAHFADFKFPGKIERGQANLTTHVVNNAMAMKSAAIAWWFSKSPQDRAAIDRLFEVMDRHHLLPNGLHAGDEHYAGLSPSQGTEVCAVVEAMFSLHLITASTGDARYGDRLEKIAYNGLPGTFDETMWAHQYDQQPNQVLVDVHRRAWTTNGPESNLFGLEPNFGCCTANFHQGWPKLASHLWMAAPGSGLAAVAYAPSTVSAAGFRLTMETAYPFRETVTVRVEAAPAAAAPLIFRIPGWAEGAGISVNGQAQAGVAPGRYHAVRRAWRAGDRVELKFPMKVRVSRHFNNSAALDRGPLVFSLNIVEEWKKLRDRGPTADWAVQPASPWNYALQLGTEKVEEIPVGPFPFGKASGVKMTIQARRLPGWQLENGSAGNPPASPVASQEPLETVTLIPYGAAKLRVTAFPVLRP